MFPLNILVVDHHSFFRRFTARYLREYADLNVIDTVEQWEEGLERARQLGPDIVLLELPALDAKGLAAIARLRTLAPHTAVIVLTTWDYDAYREAALRAGADGFVSKKFMLTELVPTIRRIARAPQAQADAANPNERRPSEDPN